MLHQKLLVLIIKLQHFFTNVRILTSQFMVVDEQSKFKNTRKRKKNILKTDNY
jgi:hypothetical protein